jgi:DNA-binding response OmpR family regulator
MVHVLVIDDDATIRALLRMLLETNGFTVSEAADGQQGLEVFRRNPAQLVITDIIMPGQDGYETCLQLKHKFRDVKIIAISGGDFLRPGKYLSLANSIGVDRVFTKPFRPAEVLAAVRALTAAPVVHSHEPVGPPTKKDGPA